MASSIETNDISIHSYVTAPVIPVTAEGAQPPLPDRLAAEVPLEIRVGHGSASGYVTSSLAVTMRTPGQDTALAAGFLLSEGIVRQASDITRIVETAQPGSHTVRVDLAVSAKFNLEAQTRHFYTTSSCGVCGKASLQAVALRGLSAIPRDSFRFPAMLIHSLPTTIRNAQPAFEATGGLHAAALFNEAGELLSLCEDVGRHNAVDKLLGKELLEHRLPLVNRLVMVSGRTSFELVQKCLAAGASILAAVGAPSSLAVDLAREFDLTLLGFVRQGRFNIYGGEWRIQHEA